MVHTQHFLDHTRLLDLGSEHCWVGFHDATLIQGTTVISVGVLMTQALVTLVRTANLSSCGCSSLGQTNSLYRLQR